MFYSGLTFGWERVGMAVGNIKCDSQCIQTWRSCKNKTAVLPLSTESMACAAPRSEDESKGKEAAPGSGLRAEARLSPHQ